MNPTRDVSHPLLTPHLTEPEHRVQLGALVLRQQFGVDFCSVTIAQLPDGISITFSTTLEAIALLVDLIHDRIGSSPTDCPTFLFNPSGDEWRIFSRHLTVRVPHRLLAGMRATPPEPYDPASAAAPPEISAA